MVFAVGSSVQPLQIRSELTKYRWVVANLDPRYASEVIDLIDRQPIESPYSAIRTALIARLSQSRQARLHQLLAGEELGDRRPSQMLRHMRSLDAEIPDDIIKTVWIEHLPEMVRPTIATQLTLPMDQLGQMADNVLEIVGGPRLAAINYQHRSMGIINNHNNNNIPINAPVNQSQLAAISTPNPQISTLEGQIMNLTNQVALLVSSLRGNQRFNRQSVQSHSRSRSHDRNRPERQLCWFHFRFGGRARRCVEPCGWSGPDNRNVQGNAQQNH